MREDSTPRPPEEKNDEEIITSDSFGETSSPYSCQASLGLAWIGGACFSETVASNKVITSERVLFFQHLCTWKNVQLNLLKKNGSWKGEKDEWEDGWMRREWWLQSPLE